jgi:hypothetical protein
VQQIEVSPHEPGKVYACILRYQLGDFSPHVYKTEDYGETWTRITTGDNGIPNDHPVRVVREDPDRRGLLYAGTEFGMFLSFDDGQRWQSFQLNLPVTPVTDIKVVEKDLALSTMGRSFWILYDVTPLHEISDQTASAEAHLFRVRDAYRLHTSRWRRPVANAARPQYPRVGANIDYYLATERPDEVRLEILDAQGETVRAFSSEEEKAAGSESLWSRLPSEAGMHRFLWDLRFPGPVPFAGPTSDGPERPEARGPMVPAGTYQARLSVGDWSDTRSFEVKLDPRVVAEGTTAAVVAEQTRLALKVRDDLSRARRAAERLEEAEKEAGGGTAEALAEIRQRLVTAPIRYSQPMLIDQLEYLYSNLIRADQPPGRDAYERQEELSTALRSELRALDRALGQP